jgi:hypothetical protein
MTTVRATRQPPRFTQMQPCYAERHENSCPLIRYLTLSCGVVCLAALVVGSMAVCLLQAGSWSDLRVLFDRNFSLSSLCGIAPGIGYADLSMSDSASGDVPLLEYEMSRRRYGMAITEINLTGKGHRHIAHHEVHAAG